MYKHVIGLNKVNQNRSLNPGKISLKKKQLDPNSENKSESSILIEDYFGGANYNNDADNDEYTEYYNGSANQVVFKDEEDDDDDYESFDIAEKEDSHSTAKNEANAVKAGCDVRMDLINEINDEFLVEDSVADKTLGNSLVQSNMIMSSEKYSADFRSSIHDDDEEDDYYKDDSLDSATNHINLNNLRIAIDEIEELVDKSNNNKMCFVFVLKIWLLDSETIARQQLQQLQQDDFLFTTKPSWSVKRKYDEFYVLDSRLKEFHGGLITSSEFNVNNPHRITVQLPPKQRALFFINNNNNIEFLNSIKDDFAKYLQSLLANPILSMSQLIKSFLDPHSIEFSSSIFNEISNFGKTLKGVPYKLRVERGQSLDTFLNTLLNSVKIAKPKTSVNRLNNEDMLGTNLNNRLFLNADRSKKVIKKAAMCNASFGDGYSEEERDEQTAIVKPFESLLFLSK